MERMGANHIVPSHALVLRLLGALLMDTHDTTKRRRRFTKRGWNILPGLLIVLLLLAGPLYSQRRQIHLLIRSWSVPPPLVQASGARRQAPVTHPLSPVAYRLPPALTGSDWTMYHAD